MCTHVCAVHIHTKHAFAFSSPGNVMSMFVYVHGHVFVGDHMCYTVHFIHVCSCVQYSHLCLHICSRISCVSTACHSAAVYMYVCTWHMHLPICVCPGPYVFVTYVHACTNIPGENSPPPPQETAWPHCLCRSLSELTLSSCRNHQGSFQL